ncbi:autotransporter outer membrane beta-barrel domain-containing protein [Achromobacter ruhlandii]|uniref:Autotransporter outer membrane beta-barrel domain-containing protein n=2 Tax=Achromobacter ruhlandii TaxID=72557 RepID=A0A848NGV7_9BURK|nr:S6 family peptidase [Achromobacter ruhlandii]NMU90354.1 autotransporter outer membrane beta-barrel domain-containing protein [Achromobacter ruhlandii]
MNKIYSLKYNHQNQLVPVSEVCGARKRGSPPGVTRRARGQGRRAALAACLPLLAAALLPGAACASYVSIDIPYQTYRDFAENKGAFQPGALGIPILNKDGTLRGNTSAAIPFIDFSSVSNDRAIETLIAPQYAVGVAHNVDHDEARFGGTVYSQIRRDLHPNYHAIRDYTQEWDFDLTRMSKLVTDVAPIARSVVARAPVSALNGNDRDRWTEAQRQQFPLFYRVGMGIQFVGPNPDLGVNMADVDPNPVDMPLKDGEHYLGYAYRWATGGMVTPTWSNETFVIAQGDKGLLPSYVEQGDSGSPLFAWDAAKAQWVVAGTAADLKMSEQGSYVYWSHLPDDFIDGILKKDNDPDVIHTAGNGALAWTFDSTQGTGALQQTAGPAYIMHGYKKSPAFALANSALDFPGLDAGKNLAFRTASGAGAGQIRLKDSVNQGAGALTFHNDYTVSPDTNQTWMGAGIDVKQDVTVAWNVNGVAGDNLHKIGAGTLAIGGTGVNPGGLRVGEGKVILSQQPGADDKVQAFAGITIASGRAEVVLGDARQVNPDRIQWGARGGVLDINGNDITFNQLADNALDHGATIANRAARKAGVTVNLSPVGPAAVTDYIIMPSRPGTGVRGDLYKRGVNYFVLKQNSFATVPSAATQTSDDYWEYAGQRQNLALELANARKREYFPTRTEFIFAGSLTDNLDVDIVNQANTAFIADGDIAIGDNAVSARQGEVVFQGHPVIHAINTPDVAQMLRDLGDDSVLTQSVSFDQPDWETRHFTLGKLALTDSTFRLARNATLQGDIDARRARVILGSPSLYINKNDGGPLAQEPERGTSIAATDADKSSYHGKVTLQDSSTLEIRELFAGAIDASDSAVSVLSDQAALTGHSRFAGSPLTLERGAHLKASGGWYDDGAVTLADGAALTLAGAPEGPAHYFTQAIALQGDNANLYLAPGSHSFSDLSSPAASRITLGASAPTDAPETVYAGSVNAAQASMRIQETAHWIVTGDSTLKQLQASQALLSFDDMTQTRNGFMARAQSGPDMPGNLSPTAAILPAYTLTADTVAATDSTFALRVDPNGGDHDRLTITTGLSGSGNRLRITEFGDRPASAAPVAREDLLLSAPASAPADLFQLEQAYTDGAADTSSGGNPWLGGLAVSHDADQRQWWFISMRDDAPWRLSQDRQFDALHLPTGGRVELSQPQAADWTPRTLQTGTLNASGVHFALTARPQDGASDSIRVATEALGDDNSLDLTLLVRGEVPDNASGRLLLASAPVSTADSYFKTGSVTQGLTVYVPNLEIVSTDTEKKWQLAYRAVERPADPPVEKPAEPPVEKPAETPEIETPQGGGASPGDAPAPDGDAGSATNPGATDTPQTSGNDDATVDPAPGVNPGPATNPGITDTPQTGDSSGSPEAPGYTAATEPAPPPADDPVLVVTPDAGGGAQTRPGLSLFTAVSLKLSELDALGSREEIVKRLGQAGVAADEGTIRQITEVRRQIARTGTLASLPRVSFMLETNQLDKRLGDVRQLNEDAGLWIKTSHGRADYQQIGLKHTTLQFGLDRKQGRQLYGIMGSYTQGSGQGDGALSEQHTTGGIGLYYALIHEDGPFVDVIAKYLKTNQTYQFPSQLNIAAQGARSTSLLASVQAGWRLNLLNGGAFIEPSAEVVAGATSGYTLHGGKDSVDVRVNASRPVYAKIGAAVGLNLQSDAQHALAVSAGLFRLQNLRRGGSIDIVNNGNPDDVLRNPMADDSRYLVNLSLNARLSANWRLYSQVESSFAGKLKHDYNGQIGVRYQF